MFIYSNSKFKVTSKNEVFECRFFKTHTTDKPYKISNISPFNIIVRKTNTQAEWPL